MDDQLQREGTLAGETIRLAWWAASDQFMPYRRLLPLVRPESQQVPGEPNEFQADPLRRLWIIDDWTGGEGAAVWQPGTGKYNYAVSVRPDPDDDPDLILGLGWARAQQTGGGGDILSETLGVADGRLWTVHQNNIAAWDPSTEVFGSYTAGSAAFQLVATNLADGADATNLYVGRANGDIDEFDHVSSTWTKLVDTTNTQAPDNMASATRSLVVDFDGSLYALQDGKIFLINKAGADGATKKHDTTASEADWRGSKNVSTLTASDKGPLWVRRTDAGVAEIWEYNHFDDTSALLGIVPDSMAYPFSIGWHFGFVWVTYRRNETGPGFLYFQNKTGTTSGVVRIGVNDTIDSTKILLAGAIGDDLYLIADRIWVYNVSDGAIHNVGNEALSAEAGWDERRLAITFGEDVFVSSVEDLVNNKECARLFTRGTYDTTDSAYLYTGYHSFGYGAVKKSLESVTLVGALDTFTEVEVLVWVDGARPDGKFGPSASTSIDTWVGDNSATSKVLTPSSPILGRTFQLGLRLETTTLDSRTPSLKAVMVQATSAERVQEWQLAVDLTGGAGADHPPLLSEIDKVLTIASSFGPQTFLDPWGEQDIYTETPTSRTVTILDVELPDMSADSRGYAIITLRKSPDAT